MNPVRDAILRGTLCRNLRTKGMFVAGDEGPPPGLPFVPDTAAFWCNLTGWAMGDDNDPANPRRCVPGRGCYEAEVEV